MNSKTVVITFKIDEDTLMLLDTLCEMRGETRSETIRKAIIEFIRKELVKNK